VVQKARRRVADILNKWDCINSFGPSAESVKPPMPEAQARLWFERGSGTPVLGDSRFARAWSFITGDNEVRLRAQVQVDWKVSPWEYLFHHGSRHKVDVAAMF
jgi:hypothetical protein